MFQRFTPEARRAIEGCQAAAERLRGGPIGTDHLLLGLIEEWLDVATAVRDELGIDLSELRAAVDRLMGDGATVARERLPSYAPDARRALMFAQDEAWRLDDPCIGTEHLLLGLLREREGNGGRALRAMGWDLDELRGRIVRVKERPLPGEERGPTALGP